MTRYEIIALNKRRIRVKETDSLSIANKYLNKEPKCYAKFIIIKRTIETINNIDDIIYCEIKYAIKKLMT